MPHHCLECSKQCRIFSNYIAMQPCREGYAGLNATEPLTSIIPIVMIIGMNKPSRPEPDKLNRLQALKAIASPIRQELLSAIAEAAASVRELSERLGRSRQALHFHIGLLEKAGLIRTMEVRGEGRDKERVYGMHHPLSVLKQVDLSPRERQHAGKATIAMLRLTQRELTRAITSDRNKSSCSVAIRAKARLDDTARAQVRKLIMQIVDLFREAKGKNRDCPFFAATLVLTPSSESGESKRHRGRNNPSRKGTE
jgi:DNA-binding transcriptional ArsR family regulator